MKDAGIEWVRDGFPYPFADEKMTVLTEEYLAAKQRIFDWIGNGFSILGITPGYGHFQPFHDPGFLRQFYGVFGREKPEGDPNQYRFYKNTPPWMADHEEEEFYDRVTATMKFLGGEYEGRIEFWQISNEMDIGRFRGSMTADQAVRYMNAQAKGIKLGNPKAKIGINPTSLESPVALYFYKTLYSPANEVEFDYCGCDGYFGTFHKGGPEDWKATIDTLYELTGKPIIVNEWGYSSLGAYFEDGWPSEPHPLGENWVCVKRGWDKIWHGGHNQETQAEYIQVALKIFSEHPRVLGSFMYDWQDDLYCFCRRPYCPHECGWGLVDRDGNPKKGYYAFQNAAATGPTP